MLKSSDNTYRIFFKFSLMDRVFYEKVLHVRIISGAIYSLNDGSSTIKFLATGVILVAMLIMRSSRKLIKLFTIVILSFNVNTRITMFVSIIDDCS